MDSLDEKILFLLAGIFYSVPTIIAAIHHEKNIGSIFFVNAVFGWTIIGWLTAVFWAIAERKTGEGKLPAAAAT